MSRITKIEAAGIKGRSFSYNLEPVTVFVGDSFSGKTAVLDAIKIGLMGYHHRLGKRVGDTFKLCNGSTMHIDLQLGNRCVVRDWAMQRGSVKYSGPDLELVPSLALDCREYFNMTGPQRMQYVFNQINPEQFGFTKDRVLSELRGLKPEEPSEDAEKVIRECVEIAEGFFKDGEAESASIQQIVEAISEDLKEKKRTADTSAQSMTGMIRGGVELRQGSEPVQNCDVELKAARDEFNSVYAALSNYENEAKRVQERNNRIETLRLTLAAEPDWSSQIADFDKEIARLEKKKSGLKDDEPTAFRNMTECDHRCRNAAEDIKRIEKQLVELTSDYDKKMAQTSCPFCKSNRKGWKDAIIAEHQEQTKELQSKMAEASKLYERAKSDYDTSIKLHAAAQAVADEIKVSTMKIETIRANITRSQAQASRIEKLRGELDGLLKTPEVSLPANEIRRLTEHRNSLSETIAQLERRQKLYVAQKSEELAAMKAKQSETAHRCAAEIFGKAVVAIKTLQKEMIAKGVGSLMDVANKFTSGILKSPLEYRNGDVGYVGKDGTWVSYEVFSGTEEALSYCALSVALAQSSEVRIVMFDELGIVDGGTKFKIVQRMLDLVKEKVIDQAVFCDVSDTVLPDGAEVVRL